MKKFLTALTLVTVCSFSANAQDTTTKVDPSVKASTKQKAATLKKERRPKETIDLDGRYADTNDEPATLGSPPSKPITHILQNF